MRVVNVTVIVIIVLTMAMAYVAHVLVLMLVTTVFLTVAIVVYPCVNVVVSVMPTRPLMTSPIEICSSRQASAPPSSNAIGISSATAADTAQVGRTPTANTTHIAAATPAATPAQTLALIVAVVAVFLLSLLLLTSRNICILLQKEIGEAPERPSPIMIPLFMLVCIICWSAAPLAVLVLIMLTRSCSVFGADAVHREVVVAI
jgi:hypothetical protein